MADTPLSTGETYRGGSTGTQGVRSLQEPVLTSVQEELEVDTPEHDTGTSYTGTDGADATLGGRSAGTGAPWWASVEDRLGRYVSEQPGKAALMALGAGALAALVLGQRMRGRRRRD